MEKLILAGAALLALVFAGASQAHTQAVDGRTWSVPVIYPGHAHTDLVIGSRFHDVIRGAGGIDDLSGWRGDDELFGGAGRDRLVGGRGADFMRGGQGDDLLIGGPGPDVLIGGAGWDRCIRDELVDLTLGCESFELRLRIGGVVIGGPR